MILGRRHVLQGASVALLGCAGSSASNPIAAPPPPLTGMVESDPFANGIGTTCELTRAVTVGPCYAKTIDRKDISERIAGLPTRLAFLVVDPSCKPIANAEVDVWHAAPMGVYSGNDAAPMCTMNDPAALSTRCFRGRQTTDARGRVDFDTRFPGWYHGRATHVHFTIRVGGREYVTSQLGFTDALVLDVADNEPIYKERGRPDTMNDRDGLIDARQTFDAVKQSNGSVLAWKAIVLRGG